MDLFETPDDNAHDFTVSELSGAVKRVIEGEFGQVRVRGEIGRVSRPASGHLYYDLKDDRSVIAAITWKGQAGKLAVRPEEGMEVIATGRMTTFPGQSKYQLIVEDIRPAGAGALMAMLEKRRKALAAEGLFDEARKRPLPWLPEVIGVVTSPSGAVIRDILHRLADRFPRHVLIWPVAVQGERCAPEVAAAIRGFNDLPAGMPKPDLLIVARGGGSLEDLWGFNEEIVVRAAADSRIPLISAVGHETDTTLIDFAADRRAPTPTAAAEMAVPVRADLLAAVDQRGAALSRCIANTFAHRDQRLRDLARALPRPESLMQVAVQRFDSWAEKLDGALGVGVSNRRARLTELAVHLRPRLLADLTARGREQLADRARALEGRMDLRHERAAERLAGLAARLAPARARAMAEAARDVVRGRERLAGVGAQLDASATARLRGLSDRLEAVDRLRVTLGHHQTLARGYAVIRGDGQVVTSKAAAEKAAVLEAEFHDGRLTLSGRVPKKTRAPKPSQGELF
ncbi:exodeoxyribonuclease VII large subunit [Falsirhodobacter halotolerans]|uniref:exodeoxyribonuclease VII large subunit n=1 Tax=Falsirhodobacter halotolerans TaxID=1146892 RepID=UPI001FD255DC|nr:exodeoxyribonuclease VII large subunit [Falsirhodobacter halotolerans]MCJ8138958.1 exodeoxyribonuclease VII large subunit [Falsirhodobacter halotolerans]